MKKAFVLSVIIFTIATSPMLSVQAYESTAMVQLDKENGIEPRADVIVKKLRLYNGVLQYRRWNETRNCWVDPDWIDVN